MREYSSRSIPGTFVRDRLYALNVERTREEARLSLGKKKGKARKANQTSVLFGEGDE